MFIKGLQTKWYLVGEHLWRKDSNDFQFNSCCYKLQFAMIMGCMVWVNGSQTRLPRTLCTALSSLSVISLLCVTDFVLQ